MQKKNDLAIEHLPPCPFSIPPLLTSPDIFSTADSSSVHSLVYLRMRMEVLTRKIDAV